MSGVSLSVNAQLSPQQIAQAFWDLGSDEMADFFAELGAISQHKLCMQIAYTVDEMARRAADGDWMAQNAFQTMLAHSQAYFEEVIGFRAFEAKQDLTRFVAGIKAGAA